MRKRISKISLEELWDASGHGPGRSPEAFEARFKIKCPQRGIFLRRHFADQQTLLKYADWLGPIGTEVREALGLPRREDDTRHNKNKDRPDP